MRLFGLVCVAAFGFASSALAGSDWGKECASYGLTVGSAEYKDCVAKMTDADKATGGTMMQDMKKDQNSGAANQQRQQMNADADKQRQQMKADADKQRAEMQKQMQDAKSNPKCVTTTQGTNTSTVCP